MVESGSDRSLKDCEEQKGQHRREKRTERCTQSALFSVPDRPEELGNPLKEGRR
jgi:hypothetical protein